MRKKAFIIAACVILAVATAVGATLAYLWTQTPPLENDLEPVKVNCKVNEAFNGDVKSNVSVTNTGDVLAYVRAAIIPTWIDSDGNTYGGEAPIEGVSYTVDFGSADWQRGQDGYYYYLKPVAAGATTTALLDTLAPVSEEIPEGYTLRVRIIASAIQAEPKNAVEQYWSVTILSDGTITLE